MKNRRRFTWILLSKNGQVAGFDGSTLQVSFINAGARDSFVGSNSDDVLRQALSDALGVDWRIECIVDPSGGGGGGGGTALSATAPTATAAAGGGWGAPARPAAAAPPMAVPAPVQPQVQAPAPVRPQPQPSAPAPAPVQAPPSAAPAPPGRPVQSVAPEDDIPEEDDPDLNEEAFSGQELIIRELGATVLEEIHHRGN